MDELVVTPEVLRREAQARNEHGYVHFATVRNMMRALADHMETMEAISTGTSTHDDVTGGYDSGRHNH